MSEKRTSNTMKNLKKSEIHQTIIYIYILWILLSNKDFFPHDNDTDFNIPSIEGSC